jgi:hypothetical protein
VYPYNSAIVGLPGCFLGKATVDVKEKRPMIVIELRFISKRKNRWPESFLGK